MANKHVVIVDDTMSIGRFLEAALMTLGLDLSIVVVPSAEEALLETSANHVDLIITDINLPGISGLDLVLKIRDSYQAMQVILITGESDIPISKYAEQLNAVAYFLKPLDSVRFLDTARQCLGGDVHTAQPEEPAALSLSDTLSGLRRRLGAVCALLIDERGRSMAQAGDLPLESFESRWAAPLMSAISAGSKVSRLLGKITPTNVMIFRGQELDIVAAPVGTFYLVLALDSEEGETQRLAQTMEETLATQKDLADGLTDLGMTLPKAEALPAHDDSWEDSAAGQPGIEQAPQSVEEVEAPGDFEELLAGSTAAAADSAADEFWESAADAGSMQPTDPDALNYEEARKLGLAPED